ncbi:thymopoietin a isoform X3 [Silurus meridionalis]|uniref:thymopoietin a isoform X3 n=1 Tax=Silurus meridionalis TaxID=175797 RepID=UPI001EE9DE64|nr:thymopoietin a isoform X3 [Silurus meridionalis]
MAEFLSDPSVLTKDKLKSALVANNVALPNGDQRKGVYVELYLKNLTSQNKKSGSGEAFSSDEEPPAPAASITARSGRKATKKTDRVRPEEIDVTELTNEDLKDQLLKYGVNAGPIVASTRKVYEKKLQKLLDQGPPQTTVISVAETVSTHNSRNGNVDSDQYSDKEEETSATVQEPELELELEPVPVVERPLRSRGKTPVTTRTRSSQNKIEKLSAVEQTPKTAEKDVLKELFPNEVLNTPTGISATCRRPIKGAASRPYSDTLQEGLRPRLTEHRYTSSSFTETRSVPHVRAVSAVPRVSAVPLSVSKPTVPLSVQTKARRRLPVWVQLLLLVAVSGFLLFVYQAMESNQLNPFGQPGDSGVVGKARK